jgi:hypothetical protein
MHFAGAIASIFMPALAVWALRCPRAGENLSAARTRNRSFAGRVSFFPAFLLSLLWFPAFAHSQGASPDPQRQSLGSLRTTGDVFVNESKAPSEVTVYAGDVVRTGDTGTAILTTSGDNSFEIARQSTLDITGEARYLAELKSGSVAVKSTGGPAGAVLRAGNFVVVPTNRNERTMVNIVKMPDGSYLFTCTEGNTGIVPLQQGQGLFLQAGQSARVSVQGDLAAVETPPSGTQHAGTRHNLWIYLGLGGAAVAGGVAAAIATRQPVSPVAP